VCLGGAVGGDEIGIFREPRHVLPSQPRGAVRVASGGEGRDLEELALAPGVPRR
jgi:hypothetical protein